MGEKVLRDMVSRLDVGLIRPEMSALAVGKAELASGLFVTRGKCRAVDELCGMCARLTAEAYRFSWSGSEEPPG